MYCKTTGLFSVGLEFKINLGVVSKYGTKSGKRIGPVREENHTRTLLSSGDQFDYKK